MSNINHRCAVLGQPIAHSLSPVLHNAAYHALGLDDWFYDRHEVGRDDLDAFLHSLDPTWAGLSLTMPLKKTIQPYGTPDDLWAGELKVANTAIFDWEHRHEDGFPYIRLYNTDVKGIVNAIGHAIGVTASGTTATGEAVVIGNGNTATSAVAACTALSNPLITHITVAARHPDKNIEELQHVAGILESTPLDAIAIDDIAPALQAADVVISTIPGHAADAIAGIIEQYDVRPHGLLLDVLYDPRPTALMKAWRTAGGLAIGGEEMLLYQAIGQVALMTARTDVNDVFTDFNADAALETSMREALKEVL